MGKPRKISRRIWQRREYWSSFIDFGRKSVALALAAELILAVVAGVVGATAAAPVVVDDGVLVVALIIIVVVFR